MAKAGLKIGIAIVLLIVAFWVWVFLHLFLCELIGSAYALISIPLVIILYITVTRFLFKLIDPGYNNTAYGNVNYGDNTNVVQGENIALRDENRMNDKEQYYNPGENIPRENNDNIKNIGLLIVIAIAIILAILILAGIL